MYPRKKTAATGLLLGMTLSLSACISPWGNKVYDFPKPGEPSANIRLKHSAGLYLQLISTDAQGCFEGSTPAAYENGYLTDKVVPDKPLILQYGTANARERCMVTFSFTPEQDASYLLGSADYSTSSPGLIPGLPHQQDYCAIEVMKEQDGQRVRQPIEQLRVKPGFKCVRFPKISGQDATLPPSARKGN